MKKNGSGVLNGALIGVFMGTLYFAIIGGCLIYLPAIHFLEGKLVPINKEIHSMYFNAVLSFGSLAGLLFGIIWGFAFSTKTLKGQNEQDRVDQFNNNVGWFVWASILALSVVVYGNNFGLMNFGKIIITFITISITKPKRVVNGKLAP